MAVVSKWCYLDHTYIQFGEKTSVNVLFLHCLHYVAATDRDRRSNIYMCPDIHSAVTGINSELESCLSYRDRQLTDTIMFLASFNQLPTHYLDESVFHKELVSLFSRVLRTIYPMSELERVKLDLPRHVNMTIPHNTGNTVNLIRRFSHVADKVLTNLLNGIDEYTQNSHRPGQPFDLSHLTTAHVILIHTSHDGIRPSEVSRSKQVLEDAMQDMSIPPASHKGVIAGLCLSIFKSVVNDKTYTCNVP